MDNQPNAPLFRDPIYDGAADPTLIWNREERTWWMMYTNRRANIDGIGFSWVHGTDIGVASSADGGQSWLYRGTVTGLEFERGRNTFWAPEIIHHDGAYHMYLSYVTGVPTHWKFPRKIVHYTSGNLWDWHFQSVIPLSSDRVIDACIHQLPSGKWRMWYKDEVNRSQTYAADSDDLYHWEVVGSAVAEPPHEGPNVFFWKGNYWMITDPWRGLAVYRSKDADHWEYQGIILDTPGNREEDQGMGQHADVIVQGDEAYIFYFLHPEIANENGSVGTKRKAQRSCIQVARLEFVDGNLVCDRNQVFPLSLKPAE
jgi:hypothetical protein